MDFEILNNVVESVLPTRETEIALVFHQSRRSSSAFVFDERSGKNLIPVAKKRYLESFLLKIGLKLQIFFDRSIVDIEILAI